MKREDYYLNIQPICRETAIRGATAVYNFCKLANPKVVFVDGPTQLKKELGDDFELIDLDRFQEISTFYTQRSFGATDMIERVVHSILWELVAPHNGRKLCYPKPFSFHDFRTDKWTEVMWHLWEESYAFVATPDICYVMERPQEVHTSKHGLHNKTGPAIVFRDGTEIFAFNGIPILEEYIKNPDSVPLDVIHGVKHKHLLIDLVGLDRYFELVKNWKPDVSGRMKKFFSFSEFVVPGDELIEESWNKKGRGHHYIDKPSVVDFRLGTINKQYGLSMVGEYEINHFDGDPFESSHMDACFESSDKVLWNQLHVRDIIGSGPIMGVELSFQNGVFRFRPGSHYYNSDRGYDSLPCRRDIVPAWFKLHMMHETDAIYEGENYVCEIKDRELSFRGDKTNISDYCFDFFEYVPTLRFNFDLTSDSWEGLLDKWARFAFEWIDMHSSSRSA